MKRRIANVLEPGETVLQALRRLKGNSDRKAKMSAETKVVFDQLTEDAMKLMENGTSQHLTAPLLSYNNLTTLHYLEFKTNLLNLEEKNREPPPKRNPLTLLKPNSQVSFWCCLVRFQPGCHAVVSH
ncbi:hypothetical protein VIGAN_07191400 [Vigna angularis var. angularis]|uniref:Uncharacterized protein n=1 Tax=Vigna angularis var. angularis TaxID=157739 RepID=A0A0S3SJL8_PHAAN|nr:hypothetical protein VIGAN_07191400 [Vigna angularis var. angularis]